MKRLPSARAVAALTEPGRYAVGHGAYLQISLWNTKSWIFRYVRNGKARHVGMGSTEYVTLSEARERAIEYRRMLARGGDPLDAKRAGKRESKETEARAKTFKQCALEYIKQHEDGWRGDSSRRQWIGSLEAHVFPKIGDMLIAGVDVGAVLSVSPKTASMRITLGVSPQQCGSMAGAGPRSCAWTEKEGRDSSDQGVTGVTPRGDGFL